MPGCNIEMLEPVTIIMTLTSPSIRTEIEGVPCFNATETAGLTTAFTLASRREDLSSFTPFCRFPNYLIRSSDLVWSGLGVFWPGDPKGLVCSVWFFLPGCRELPCSLFNLVGHSLAKCPIPSHS